jgi:hypothetical protein
MKKIVFILSLLACQATVFAQLGVGTNSPDASAQLDVTASNKGFLAPRIALASATDVTTIATPATGLMIYNTATAGTSPNNVTPGYYYYDGVKWVRFINSQPSATISFNTADPNSGSPTFTPNTTQNSGYIYVSSTNSSLWVWNGSAYVSYAAPASTPFSLSGTSTDAGGNKTASIYRSGGIIAGGTSSSAMYGNLTAVGGSNFSGAIPNGTASIGLISNSTAGWSGTGFLFGNANSGSNAFSLVVNNDKHYHAWLTPTNTYNLTSISNATGWIFGSNLNAGWTPSYALEARGELVSTSNAYFATAGGKVGINTTTPYSSLSNTTQNILGSDAIGTSSTGITWFNQYIGYSAGVFNSGTSANFNGLAIKIAGNSSSNRALDISQGTSQNAAGTPLFDVLGNGNVGIRTNSPATSLHMNSNLVATNTINADGQMLRMTRPQNPTVKWDNIAQFNLGAYDASNTNASTRLDLALNDGAGVTTANVMTWLANGRVGIGTTAPTTNLDVVGGINLRNVIGAAGTNYGIEFNTNSTAPRIDWVFNGAYIGQFASDANDFHLRNSKLSTGGFRFFTNPAGSQVERLTILNNGYVGVGVASPVSTLANTSLPIQGSNTPNAFNGGLTWSTPGTGFAASFYSQPSNGNGLLVKIAGNSSSNNAFEVSSSISQESNVNNPINPLFNVKGNGNVGVGTFTPASKLEVNGSATNTSAFSAGSGTTINFANSNLAYTTASAGSFTLSNIKDGGTYTLAVQGATSGTASFTCSGFTFISVNNGITAPNKHTLYTFIVMGTNVYVYMATGF